MAHCKPEELKDCAELIAGFRAVEGLTEKSLGCFYRKAKSVLHFHRKGERRYLHVWDGKAWQEVDVPTPLSAAASRRILKEVSALVS